MLFAAGIAGCGGNDDDGDSANLTASFTYEQADSDSKMIIFTNTSENADTYLWSFGDGETSTEKSPTHVYDEAGSYTVTLIAYNEAGANKETSEQITIGGGSNVTRMVIEEVRLTRFPTLDPEGDNWDNPLTGTPEPDIYLEIEAGGRTYGSDDNRFPNAELSDLPLSWNADVTVSDLSSRVEVDVYDYNSLEPSEYMGGFWFIPESESGSLPDEIVLSNASSDYRFELSVRWN